VTSAKIKAGSLWWVPTGDKEGYTLHLLTGKHADGTVTTVQVEDVSRLDFDDDAPGCMGCFPIDIFIAVCLPARRYLKPTR
jgi:hypothetical protein